MQRKINLKAVSHLCKTRYMQALSMFPGGFAGLPWPSPLPLCVRETRPREDVMIGQVKISRIHRELANELQQTRETVQQPLKRDKRRNVISTAVQLRRVKLTKKISWTHFTLKPKGKKIKSLCKCYMRQMLLTLTTVQDSCSFGSKIAELKMSSRS